MSEEEKKEEEEGGELSDGSRMEWDREEVRTRFVYTSSLGLQTYQIHYLQ